MTCCSLRAGGWQLIAALLASCGSVGPDATAPAVDGVDETLDRVRRVYGPPQWLPVVRNLMRFDLNGDGAEEVVVFFFEPDIAPGSQLTEADLHGHLTCNGFAVLTGVEGAWWPVFYQFDDYRMGLRLGHVDGHTLTYEQLIRYNAGNQTTWGWEHHPDLEDDFHRGWHSRWRSWDAEREAFSSSWHVGRFYASNVGK